jgi:hypothetical protein
MHDCIIGFTSYQHLNWVVSSKRLSDSETIRRDEAVTTMRDLSLDLKNRHRIVLIPTALMVFGGVLVIVDGRRTKKNSDRKIHLRSTRGL